MSAIWGAVTGFHFATMTAPAWLALACAVAFHGVLGYLAFYDRNMSILEGSISAIQIRILVPDEHVAEARELLIEAELGGWLRQ